MICSWREGLAREASRPGQRERRRILQFPYGAHPEPNHYLRKNIRGLTSHSLRVTAAVALYNAGVSIDEIAFRLRWHSEAVKLYLRDHYAHIGDLTKKVIVGAYISNR